jgi:hypothetical protein
VVGPANTETVLVGATVVVKGTTLSTVTNSDGAFSFDIPQQKVVLIISYVGFPEKTVEVDLNGNPVVDIGRVSMGQATQVVNDTTPADDIQDDAPEITLSESELEETDASIGTISGILSSSRDRYQNTAGYQFGTSRYKIKGFNSEQGSITINGIPMNDPETGWASFSLWGGLNDMTRYPAVVPGIGFSENSYGNVGGQVNYNMLAAEKGKGGRVTYSYGNRNYTHRAMLTYNTGLLKNGWAFSLSGSRRMADEGYVEGTFYDAWSYYLGIEKRINDKQSINFVAFGAPRKYGRSAASTQEAYDLAGSNYYNPNWGYQDGKKRNAVVGQYHQPFIAFTHLWKISESSDLKTSISTVFGRGGSTSLNWVNGDDPRPDYYKNLPSYFTLTKYSIADYQAAVADWKNNESRRQLNWEKFYTTNSNRLDVIEDADNTAGNTITGKRSNYIIYERRNDKKQFNFNTIYNKSIGNLIWNTGLNATIYKGYQYAMLVDLLGGDYYLDVDKYVIRDSIPEGGQRFPNASNSDLNNKNNVVYKGEKFGYDYVANINKVEAFGQIGYSLSKLEVMAGAKIQNTTFWRTGKMKNGVHAGDSYGDSEKLNFLDFGVKGGITYKLDGRNYFVYNVTYQTDAPTFRNSFETARTSNNVVDDLTSRKVFATDLSYNLRLPFIKARISGYYSKNKDDISVRNVYIEGRDEQTSSGGVYGSYIWRGLDRVHYGLELGMDVNITPSLEYTLAGGLGNFRYANRPTIQVISDNGMTNATDIAYLKNYRIGGYPQSALATGMRYSGKHYWFAGFTINYFADIYMDIFPERHTQFALEGYTPDHPNWNKLLDQKKLDNQMTVDLFFGKSWKIKDYTLALNGNVTNLLNNTDFAFTGFEQYRVDRTNPDRFQPKYSYMYGTQFFINLNLRF